MAEVADLADDVIVIKIDYEAGTPDPGRVFRSMAGLIDAFSRIDRHLAHAVAAHVEPEVILERVEASSIRAVLRTLLLQVDDEALRTLDWKPLIGQYLVRAKHALLRRLDGRPRITSRAEVVEIQQELLKLAPADIHLLPAAPIAVEDLLWDIEAMSRAVAELRADDSAEYITSEGETRIETRLRITSDEIESLLTQDVITSDSEQTLLVKKPDYLGHSMWELRLGERAIEAKMLDEEWLDRFRRQEIPLRPGDALRVLMRMETVRGFEGSEVAVHYYVRRVLGVVPISIPHQPDLL